MSRFAGLGIAAFDNSWSCPLAHRVLKPTSSIIASRM
jgi:hypothetical protein